MTTTGDFNLLCHNFVLGKSSFKITGLIYLKLRRNYHYHVSITASWHLVPSHHGRWEKMETVKDFIFLGSKITMDSDCSHEIKRHLGKKAMTNLGSIFKSRDIILPIKVCRVKAMVFPVVMYGCESWTIKKAEH